MDRGDPLQNRLERGRPEALGASRPGGWGRTVALAVILALFWFLLSGRFTLPFLLMMAASVTTVLIVNPERPFGGGRRLAADSSRGLGFRGRLQAAGYLVRFLVWLLWAVIWANVDVAIRILHPKLPIRPRLLTFETTLEHPVAQALVANSITLTPGTVTIDLEDNRYLVHALAPETAGAVTKGSLQNVIAPVFGEGPEPVPDVRWGSSYRELRT